MKAELGISRVYSELEIAVRRLLRSPLFTAVTVLTLAVGVGASASVFSVIQSVLISPLPYPDAESLVGVWHSDPVDEKWGHAHISYQFYRETNQVFDEIGLYQRGEANLTGGERPEELPAVEATPSLFRVLGVQPSLGRMFLDGEGAPGAAPVVIVSHALWQRRFGGDPDVVGTRVWIGGVSREVVGVMPPGFRITDVKAEVILPMTIDRSQPERGKWGNICVARLRPGQTTETAQNEMEALARRVHEAFPDPESTRKAFETAQITALVTPLKEDVVGGVSELLWILFGCVGVVLAIAVANVANLFLIRTDDRRQETALRSALGATRPAIARCTAVESLIITLAGGGTGLALAVVGVRLFQKLAPPGMPRLEDVTVGPQVAAFVLAVATLSGLIFGLLPVVRRTDELSMVLGDGGRSATSGRARQRVRDTLVVSQLALALMLIVMSGLMIRSFLELRSADPGCDPRGVITMRLPITDAEYPQAADAFAFYNEVLDRVRALPGIESAGVTTGVPVEDRGLILGHSFEDLPRGEDEIAPNYRTHLVLPDALETLSIPLLAGRRFAAEDLGGEARTVMISESLARLVWSSPADAIGRRMMPGRPQDGGVWYTIVGVVGDAPYGGLADGINETIYYPFWSLNVNSRDRLYTIQLELVLKTQRSPSFLARAAAKEVWMVDPDVPVVEIRTLDEVLAEATLRTRFTMMLLLVAAGAAIVLGAVGLFGAISYLVGLRTREIGIRIALGADPAEIRRMVLGRGFNLTLIGLVLGLTAGVVAGRIAESQLYGVGAVDPFTIGFGSILMVGVALLASYLPARRAAALDPLEALRYG